MLGGEIYYRAMGRPWGLAADFIITVKFHPVGWARQAARAARERLELVEVRVRQGRQKVLRSTIPAAGPPPEPSVCPTVRPSWPPVYPPVRPVRSCCPSGKPVFRSGPVKKKYQGQHHYTHSRYCHWAGKRFKMNNRKPKNVGLVLPTPFHTSPYTHDLEHEHTVN
jgi:hypothetical protein